MRYIKLSVPDDFDPQTHQVWLHSPIVNHKYPDYPDWKRKQCQVWEPIYKEVLDKGFIGLIDFMGDDDAVVQAARVSYGTGTKRVSEDRNLIRYLIRHRHWTPIEMCEFKWHCKAPIFVFRQWVRHRTANVNEYSGRFSVMSDDMYMPDLDVLKPQSSANKQGRDGSLSENNAYACQLQLQHIYQECHQAYLYLLGQSKVASTSLNHRYDFVQKFALDRIKWLEANDPDWQPNLITEQMVNDKIQEVVTANGLAFTDEDFWDEGLSREIARIALPVSTYSEMYWKCDLRNTLNFISLRSDPHAQYEIKVYSDLMLEMLEPIVPVCVGAFIDYQLKGHQFSSMELDVIKTLYQRQPDQALVEEMMKSRGASKRETTEFIKSLECEF